MKERRREEERRVEREAEGTRKEEEESEGEKGRATSARSRATIGDHLPSSATLFVLDLSGGGSEGENSTTRRFAAAAAAAAAIIKLFTHTERYLSSEQRDHNVLLFDPHFVSDLSLTASRETICTWQILLARSGVLLTISRGSSSGVGERIARQIILLEHYVSHFRSGRNSNMRAEIEKRHE